MISKIAFGGGCHWCTEAVFASLKGVVKTEQGYLSSIAPNDSFSEGVIVHYDANIINLEDLVEIHLLTHSSTSMHSMRDKYRSAVYVFNKVQKEEVTAIIESLQKDFTASIITKSLIFKAFKSSVERYHNYYLNNAENTFCTRYINPKLELLKKKYSKYFIQPPL